ncbi:prokaryotic E2 ligase family D protein [Mucilaginibacter sp. BJC16-A38]|uniref:prokaryotic E2 ligase family D protein n=1 Tax=Mucilaginibacter phenanthrenivorans TaxID=1234842 RepID=UPI0021574DEB|nr:prokaryotic E2 ligase family D protein [Mucilaginibacter phenanthrenivorans]MCR8560317.1 prokaryotic E2 ligase family D protein [Mucilaginibacter phenanthrenivorans]
MKNLTNNFCNSYQPVKALLICQKQTTVEDGGGESNIYVESYDIGKFGKPINAHPLTFKETLQLSGLFQAAEEMKTGFLRSRGIIPNQVLYVNPQNGGYAVWFTPPQEVPLYFASALGIKSGRGKVPAMVWKAGREELAVFALKGGKKPTGNTKLFHAPFFNIYRTGRVCMGTVRINISESARLEDFMAQWENYYWNSYFSHLMDDFNPVTENIVQLWQTQVKTENAFPTHLLKSTNDTLQSLIT